MRIIGLKKGISVLATSLVAVAASAQQGIGTDMPHKSSVLELQSSKRGLLIPRIRLTATNQKAPVNAPENSLLVYNTNTTTGVNKVEPGYYYWSQADNSWMRIINQKDVATAISNVADTKVTGATLSGTTLTIKQSGSAPDITVNLAALDTNTTYSADNTSVKLTGTTFKRGALTGDVESAVGSTETKVTKIQGQAVSATPATNGQVLKWNGTAWAPAADADTQSKETVKGTGVVKVEGSGSAGDNNRSFTVSIESAGPSGTKVLQSVDGTVKWADAPAAGGPDVFGVNAQKESTVSDNALKRVAEDADGDLTDALATYPNAMIIKVIGGTGIKLPDASLYPARVFSIQNFAGGNRNIDNIASLSTTIRVASSFLLWSDGENWWVLSGRLG